MKKVVLQGLATIGSFFLVWFVLNLVNWNSVLHLNQVTEQTEKVLGELYWNFFKAGKNEVQNVELTEPVEQWLNHICRSNSMDPTKVKIHLVQSEEVNAFALPDHHLVIFTGLLAMADNEAEICGVIGHELSHMENNHVMKKLIREIGLTTVMASATGSNSNLIQEAVRNLTSTAYDREMETQADRQAVQYMKKAHLNPNSYAEMLYKLAQTQPRENQILTILSTHPDTYKRVDAVTSEGSLSAHKEFAMVASKETWVRFKQALSNR